GDERGAGRADLQRSHAWEAAHVRANGGTGAARPSDRGGGSPRRDRVPLLHWTWSRDAQAPRLVVGTEGVGCEGWPRARRGTAAEGDGGRGGVLLVPRYRRAGRLRGRVSDPGVRRGARRLTRARDPQPSLRRGRAEG